MQVLLIPKCFAIQPSKNNEILPKELTFWGRTESMEYHHYFKPQACLTLSDTTSRSGGLEAPPSGSPRVPPVPCGGKRRAELAMTGPVFGALATIMPQAALSPSQTRKLGARGGRECLIPIGCRAGGRSIPPFWKVLRRLRRWGTGGGGLHEGGRRFSRCRAATRGHSESHSGLRFRDRVPTSILWLQKRACS